MFKQFSIFVGYDSRVTDYTTNQKGRIPKQEVMEWLWENVGQDTWQYDWEPRIDPVIKNSDIMSYIEEFNQNAKKSGATFYFDSEEDRLLFCLKWISKDNEEPLFWHPV